MAGQVPYSGSPEVSAQVNPLSTVQQDTPIAAFGGAVAGAITHLGETTQGAGKELFARGYAMQELNEQMKADMAAASTTDRMVQRYLEYDKLKGQDRVAGNKAYNDDIAKIREDGAAELDSPYAKIQYLRDSRRTQTAMIWHGGTLARQGQDEALLTSSVAKSDAVSDRLSKLGVGEGPEFNQGVADIKTTAGNYVTERMGLHPGDPGYDEEIRKFVSPHVVKIVQGVGRTDATKGKALLDQYVKSGLVRPDDAIKIGPQLDAAVETRDAREVGHSVARGTSDVWGNEHYSDPVALEGLKAAGNVSYNQVGPKREDGTYSVGKYGVSSALLAKALPDAGLISESGNAVKTEADFLNSPKAQNDFAKSEWGKIKADSKDFKSGFKTWTGEDNPTRLNAALGGIARNSDPAEVATKARDTMAKRAPNSPIGQDNAAAIAVQNQNLDRRVERLSEQRDRNEVIGMINGANTLDGRVPQSLDEALQDKGFAEKYYRLPPDDQLAVTKILHQNSDLGGVRENSVGLNEYQRLKSIMINRDTSSTSKELDEAVNTNLLQLPLSPQHRSELMGLQHKVMQGEIANPNLTHAMGLPAVRKMLSDAGIDKTSNPDAYQKFTNSYHDALVAYGAGAERSVKQDGEFEQVAKSLISEHARTWSGWWKGEKQPYEDLMGTSAAMKKQGQSLFMKAYGRSMVPDEQADTDAANKLLLQAIYNKFGTDAKPIKSKTNSRAQ